MRKNIEIMKRQKSKGAWRYGREKSCSGGILFEFLYEKSLEGKNNTNTRNKQPIG